MSIEIKTTLPRWLSKKAQTLPNQDRKAVLREMGTKSLTLIRDRVQAGNDTDGAAFKPYSTTPIYVSRTQRDMVAPRGGRRTFLSSGRTRTVQRQYNVGVRGGRVGLVQSRTGHIALDKSTRQMQSVFYAGGYAEYRAASGLGSSPVNLSNKGRMLRAMKVKRVDSEEALVGWSGGKEALKAHGHMSGANHLPIRKFFGLSVEDKRKLIASITPTVMRLVHKNTDQGG